MSLMPFVQWRTLGGGFLQPRYAPHLFNEGEEKNV